MSYNNIFDNSSFESTSSKQRPHSMGCNERARTHAQFGMCVGWRTHNNTNKIYDYHKANEINITSKLKHLPETNNKYYLLCLFTAYFSFVLYVMGSPSPPVRLFLAFFFFHICLHPIWLVAFRVIFLSIPLLCLSISLVSCWFFCLS